MKLKSTVDKLFSHKLFSNKYFLYAVVAASVLTNYMHIAARHYEVVGFFILVGIVTMNFSKNIAVVLTVCLLLTQIIMAGKAVQEGLKNMDIPRNIAKELMHINNDKNHFPGVSGDWANWLEKPENKTKYNDLYSEAKRLNNAYKDLNNEWTKISNTNYDKEYRKTAALQKITDKYNNYISDAGKGYNSALNALVNKVKDLQKQEKAAKEAAKAATQPAVTTPAVAPAVTPVTTPATPASTAPKPADIKPASVTNVSKTSADAIQKTLTKKFNRRFGRQNFALLNDNDTDMDEDNNGFEFLGPADISGLTQGTTNLMTKQKDLFSLMNSMTPLVENAKKMLAGLDLSKLQAK